MTDLLDPSALLQSLPSLLPLNGKTLGSQYDAIACLLHTALIALGFRLIAVDDAAPASAVLLDGVLPAEWNNHSPGNYTFRYRHEQSSLEYVVKVAKLGSRTLINAIAVESDKAASLDVSTDDFTSPSFFPYTFTTEGAPPLVHGFISSNRVADIIGQFKVKIIQKLIPSLNKQGYTEQSEENRGEPTSASSMPPRPQPYLPPHRPDLPSDLQPRVPPQNPLEIGRRDLDPLGLGSNPFAPPPLFPSQADGMYVGPNHPIFGGRGQGGGLGRGPWGGDGYLPPMGAPPGARFDPVGPNFGGQGGFPRGGLPGRGNLHGPDNDEFLPPGPTHDDMYM